MKSTLMIKDLSLAKQLEQERCAEVEAIRAALIEGEAPRPFDAGAFKQRMMGARGA